MKRTVALIGLRHAHIFGLLDQIVKHPELELTAICESNADASDALCHRYPELKITDDDPEAMLQRRQFDMVAIGDCYGKRGAIAILALKHNCNVISDKPLCTALAELDAIAALVAERWLSVGCLFDIRNVPAFVTARELIRSKQLGKIIQIQFTGQHQLLYGIRPSWYFEPGMHGGTLNDIACHAIDVLPWLTGSELKRIVAARTWSACGIPGFNDAAQLMLELDNGCGVLGDVSYSAPDAPECILPSYWRFNIWGTNGMIEFNCSDGEPLKLYANGSRGVSLLAAPLATGLTPLESFLLELNGGNPELNTGSVLKSSRQALLLQQAGEHSS